MKIFISLIALLSFQMCFAQNDLLDELKDKNDSTTQLLPPKMIITQRILWGEKGLMRPIIHLNMENREKELKVIS